MRALAIATALVTAAAGPALAAAPAQPRTPAPAAPPGKYVDLQLVLAVDVSRSMDYNEQRIQRDGYVAAFKSNEVIQAILSGGYGRIAVTYVEWSGAFYQQTLVPWHIVGTAAEVQGFADALARAPLLVDNRTSISGGLQFAAGAFNFSGVQSDRRTIDVSGDGANNEGPALPPVREYVLKQGININGLPLLLDPSPTIGPYGRVSLSDYYEDCVIGGPGSFVIPVLKITDIAPAIRRKLILEIAAVPPADPALVPVSALSERPRIDCVLAEALRGGGTFP
jgi:hypothetical protein